MTTVRVAVLDAGAVRNLGWAAVDVDASPDRAGFAGPPRPADRGTGLDGLVACVDHALRNDVPVALGFECPCFVPVRDDVGTLLDQRPGEAGKAFSAQAGAFVLVDGLVESAWVLERLAAPGLSATVDPTSWPSSHRLFLWEAFVSGEGKRGADYQSIPDGWLGDPDGEHVRDAATAVMAFVHNGWPSAEHSAIDTGGERAFNTLAAAALRADLVTDLAELKRCAYVVKAR